LAARPAGFQLERLALDKAVLAQPLAQRVDRDRSALGGSRMKKSDHWDFPRRLLRARRQRPRRRTAEQPHERAALHSMTSSARASRVAGTSRPSALAVFRLTTVSYLVGVWTGRSPGFSPLRIRSR